MIVYMQVTGEYISSKGLQIKAPESTLVEHKTTKDGNRYITLIEHNN